MISSRGKEQKNSLEGQIRAEWDNGRIVYLNAAGVIVREDTGTGSNFYNDAGLLVGRIGIQLDNYFGISTFDPATGLETYRNGILPDGSAGWVVAKEGGSIQDGF